MSHISFLTKSEQEQKAPDCINSYVNLISKIEKGCMSYFGRSKFGKCDFSGDYCQASQTMAKDQNGI